MGSPAVYVSYEEGISENVGSRLRWLEITEEELHFIPSCDPSTALSTANERGARLLILDSWSVANWSLTDLSQITEHISFIFILHQTKAVQHAGPQYLSHYVDQVIKAEAGRYEFEKNRFGELHKGEIFSCSNSEADI